PLGRPGHGDIAVDRSGHARSEAIRVDEHHQIELEALRKFGRQHPDAIITRNCPLLDLARGDHTRDTVPAVGTPVLEYSPQLGGPSIVHGSSGTANGPRHPRIGHHLPNDGLSGTHDLLWRAVVDV